MSLILLKWWTKNEDLLECERCKMFRNVREREVEMKDESGVRMGQGMSMRN